MTAEKPSILMMGLPESGKSTYLGALYHGLVNSNVDSFQLGELPHDREYLMELERDWLSMREVERNRHRGRDVTLDLVVDGRQLVLDIPDNMLGIVTTKEGRPLAAGEIASQPVEGHNSFQDAQVFVDGGGGKGLQEQVVLAGGTEESTRSGEEWNPEQAPTQAILCDLLEQVGDLRGGGFPAIGLLVSAWDQAEEYDLTVPDWLEWKVPLLAQWIRSNEQGMRVAKYGVSAQGGDVSDERVRQRLARSAGQRPLPKNGSPIEEPLKWLLSLPG